MSARVSPRCGRCGLGGAVARRAGRQQQQQGALCRVCFCASVEETVHELVVREGLVARGDRIAIAISGGKDSTALAHIMHRLNTQHGYGAELLLLAVDEGIAGYRDESLAAVHRNAEQCGLPLLVISFADLYGTTLDAVAAHTGGHNTCTYCGVFRRQAFDRGASRLGCNKVATGHCADDNAETVLLNLLRGDSPRLHRCRGASSPGEGACLPRLKPLAGLTEREIVLYAHLQHLDYFATECPYAATAFRGHARRLIKQLEAVCPSAVLDIVRSGDAFTVVSQQQRPSTASPASSTTACTKCGYPTSGNGLCKACSLLASLTW